MGKATTRTTTAHLDEGWVEATPEGIQFVSWRGTAQHKVRLDFAEHETSAQVVIEQSLLWLKRRRIRIEDALRVIGDELTEAKGGQR